MREEVYNFLREYGFEKEEVNKLEDENERMFFTNMMEVNKNIDFLLNKGLVKEEIMEVFRKNPFMITVKSKKLEVLDNIYINDLKFSKDDIKKIIIDNPDTYITNPLEFNKIIEYLKGYECTIDVIKEFILDNPSVASLDFDEFKNLVKFK